MTPISSAFVPACSATAKLGACHAVLISFSDDFALGTRAIASLVVAHGYRCTLIFMKRHNAHHYRLNERNYDDLLALLGELAPDIIGLSVATKILPQAEEATRRIRAALPAALLLWGGWHPTMNPQRVADSGIDIDGLCIGESEGTMLEIMERLASGRALDACAGLWLRAGAGFQRTPPRPLIQDLDSIPFFRYERVPSYLIDDAGVHRANALATGFGAMHRGYALLSSRGCPYNCSFCSVPFTKALYQDQQGRFIRRRSVESVIEELIYARDQLGANYIWFFDEEFLFDRKWVQRFMPQYRARVGLDWYCEAHPDSFYDLPFVDLLVESGMKDLEIGLQSASPHTLELFNRPLRRREDLLWVSRRLARSRVVVVYDVILDNKLESADDVRITLDYLLGLQRPFKLHLFPLAFRDNYPLTTLALARGDITLDELETDDLVRRGKFDGAAEQRARNDVGEFPFVELTQLNALVYLTQVDFFPKRLIRWLSCRPPSAGITRVLATLVLFVHRARLDHPRFLARRVAALLQALLRDPAHGWRMRRSHTLWLDRPDTSVNG